MKKLVLILTIILLASPAFAFSKRTVSTGAMTQIVQPFRAATMTYSGTSPHIPVVLSKSITPLTDVYYTGDMAGNFTMCVDIDQCLGGETCGIGVRQEVSPDNISWYKVNSTDWEVFAAKNITDTYCDDVVLKPSLYTRFNVAVTGTVLYKNLFIMGN